VGGRAWGAGAGGPVRPRYRTVLARAPPRPRGRDRRRRPAGARAERLRVAARARQLRPAVAAGAGLPGFVNRARVAPADPAGAADRGPARAGRRHPAARPAADRRAAAQHPGTRPARRGHRGGAVQAPAHASRGRAARAPSRRLLRPVPNRARPGGGACAQSRDLPRTAGPGRLILCLPNRLITVRFPADHAGMALLRNRNFALLFTGQGVSPLGDRLGSAPRAWLGWSLTHGVGAVALVTIAANAPTFAVTLIGASYADRYDRRRLMIGTDMARGALVAVAALLLALGLLHFALLVVVAGVLAAIGAPFTPARNALVARIAPAGALVAANGLLQVSFRAAFFVGPLLLAPLLAIASMPLVLTLDALTFAVSAVTLAAIDARPASPARTRPGLRDDLGAGLAVLRREPDVLLVIVTFVLALAAASGFLTVGVIALVGQKLGGPAGESGPPLGSPAGAGG